MAGLVTTTEPDDQPPTAGIVVGNSDVATANASTMKTDLDGAGATLYSFSQEWTVAYNGQTITFRPFTGYQLDSALYNWLVENGITPVAV